MNNCIFCKIINGEIPSHKVYEDEHTYAFLDINPATEYHTLVVPKAHYENMFDIPEEQAVHVMRAVKRIVDLYKRKLGIKNLQVINNSGAEAQQEVFHLHYHIVPRKLGDGQDIKWVTHPEFRENFDDLVNKLFV